MTRLIFKPNFLFDFQAIDILRNSQANVRLKVRKCQLEAVPDSIPPGQGQITLTEVPGKITLFNFVLHSYATYCDFYGSKN